MRIHHTMKGFRKNIFQNNVRTLNNIIDINLEVKSVSKMQL